MRGFKSPRSKVLKFVRDDLDEVVEVRLTAPAFGATEMWREAFRAGGGKDEDFAYIMLGLALGDQLAEPLRGSTMGDVAAMVGRIRKELADANFTEGEVFTMLQAVSAVCMKATEVADAAKNSSAPAAGGA